MTQATDEDGRQGLADQASAKVQGAATTAQEKVRDQLDQRSTEAGSQVRSLGEALRRSGSDLSNEGNSNAARMTGPAADWIERLGSYLEQKSGDDFMRDVERFARGRPWMLAGIGMLTGMAAARFIKASSERRYSDDRSGSGQQWPMRPDVTPSSGAGFYGRGGHGPGQASVGSDVPGAVRDDPLTRDPYAGTR